GGGQNRAEQHPIPIHPSGSPSPPRQIQNKLLIAISGSRKSRRNSVHYPVNPGYRCSLRIIWCLRKRATHPNRRTRAPQGRSGKRWGLSLFAQPASAQLVGSRSVQATMRECHRRRCSRQHHHDGLRYELRHKAGFLILMKRSRDLTHHDPRGIASIGQVIAVSRKTLISRLISKSTPRKRVASKT